MTTSSPLRRGLALAAAFTLTLAACGGSDDETAEAAEVTTTAAVEPTETTAGEETVATTDDEVDEAPEDETASDDEGAADDGSSAEEIPFGNCDADQAPIPGQVYGVSNIPADDPDGGLVARQLPGSSEQAINVLPDGTIVDIFEDDECVVLSDGSIWWFVNTPLLATGGFVNSAFLAGQTDLGQEGDGSAAGEDEDGFDVVLTQIDCVYFAGAESCALLVTFGIGTADDNYGLGNAYSMAPSGFLAEDCLVSFDEIACAELELRGPGGEIQLIGADFIRAYQAGDVAAQEALSGERNTAINATDLTDSQGEFGLASAGYFDNEISWTTQPTISARCIAAEGLVQFCVVIGD